MTLALRACFVALLVLSLTWKVAAPPPRATANPRSALAAVLGGRLTGPVVSDRDRPDSLSAPVLGCTAPLRIVSVMPSVSTAPLLAA